MGKVSFFNADVIFHLPGKRKLKAVINNLFQLEKKTYASLNYIFCTDIYLLEVNKTFLQHDFYTDIITFDLSDPNEKDVVGEIYISIDRVKENTLQYSTSFKVELHRVMFHGALHLCGYKDKKKSEITKMRQKEDAYLRLFEEIKNP